jgi:hypothetical protein
MSGFRIHPKDETFDHTYLSLGVGWQSTAMLVCSALGLENVPRADFAVFADTGDEPQWVYDALRVLERFGDEHGIPVHTTSKGKLSEWVIDRQKQGKRFVSVPLYTAAPDGGREGMLRRQCTREFKVEPIERFVRTHLGYKPRQRIKERVRSLIGISIDEAIRMKPSRTRWISNRYPLVDAEITRARCKEIVLEAGLPEPKKSSCVYCPYHSDAFWKELKEEHPEEFQKAVDFDHAIRNMTMRGTTQPGYVHRSCVPLDEAEFKTGDDAQEDAFGGDFAGECEGMCGV